MDFSKLLFLIILIFGLSLTASSQSVESTHKEILENYLDVIHLKKGFNGEILVAEANDILFQKTVGMASFENNVRLNIGAKYRIASISKTFTGTLIAMAQEEQKFHLQDKATDYIPDLPAKFKDITIEQLLTHSSGLPHNDGIEDYWKVKSKLQMTTEEVISEINSLDLLFPPGSAMSYSSLGYFLLAVILENVYNEGFEQILKEKILGKLQMTETGIVDNLKIIPNMVSGYHLLSDDSLVVAPYRNYSMLKGAGDMYSTATDLLKWNNSFFSNALLPEKISTVSRTTKSDIGYSYGWQISYNIPQKKYHGGGTWGYSTFIAKYPDSKISIIILSNASTLPMNAIASDVEKIVFGKPFEMPSLEKISKDSVNLEMYTGDFISDSNKMVLTISKIDNGLYAKLGNNPPFEIYPKGNQQFFGKKIEIEFTFEITNDLITGLKAERMGQLFYFKKDTK